VYSPKTTSGFYKFTIDIIYSFIIGLSFLQLDGMITPVGKISENIIPLFGVGLIYGIIISGWVGYHRSIMLHAHWRELGTLRYLLDLCIMFIVYNLLLVSDPSSKTMYAQIFVFLSPALFTLYVWWDAVKFFELRRKYPQYMGATNHIKITFVFGMVTIIMAVAYLYMCSNYSVEFGFC
jgi:hypothetical protein